MRGGIEKLLEGVNMLFKDAGLQHKGHYLPAEDSTVDPQLEFRLFGVPSSISIQLCQDGSCEVVEHFYENGNLCAAKYHGSHRDLWRAVEQAGSIILARVS